MKSYINSKEILACERVEKTFKSGKTSIQVIKPVSFCIQRGTKNLITGKSGSGKTTLLTMLAGLEPPTKGKIYYKGKDFYQLSEKEQAALRGLNYGFVFQSFHLIPELTVQDNIRVPAMINGCTLDVDFYERILRLLQLKSKSKAYPTELSGGEQQRTAIARAMILKPSILFADEPTGNLDHRNGLRIMDTLCELNQRFGTTIILVTHDLNLMKNFDYKFQLCDGVLMKRKENC